jgi:hypothetical protein
VDVGEGGEAGDVRPVVRSSLVSACSLFTVLLINTDRHNELSASSIFFILFTDILSTLRRSSLSRYLALIIDGREPEFQP